MNNRAAAFFQAARGPVLLILLGFLMALQQSGKLEFSRSWPLLIIAIGCMKLAERMVAGPNAYVPPAGTAAPSTAYPPNYVPPPPPGQQRPPAQPPRGNV